MRGTIQSVLESLLGMALVLAGLGGLVAGGAYVWRGPQTPVVIRPQPLKSSGTSLQLLQPQQPDLPTAVVPTPVPPTPVAPEPSGAQEIPAQPNQPEPAPTPEAQTDAAATAVAADATAVAQVQCQTPNTWFLPTGAANRPRITARFGKQAETSPYFLALLQNGLIPANAPNVVHTGIDFGVDANTPLFAVADGEVISVDYSDLYGKHLLMKTREGEVLYAHLNEIFVQAGETVTCSQPIGLSGATGKALTGAHLHLELRNNGKPVDPMPLIKRSLGADKPDWLK
jgi:murein DD-endopeptidase MepM/ murein hydrolase activator NlpD